MLERSIALPRAVPVIATAPTSPPPEAIAYGSAMPRRSQYTNQDNVADEESLLLNGEPPASPTAQPDLIASKEGTDSIDAEVDVLLGRSPQSPQQTPNSLPVNSPSLNGQYLQVGTNASGKLITPVLNPSSVTPTAYTNWATNLSNPNTQRFAVQLASPLPNAYGQPILKEGTLIVFTVASVAPNGWVNATAESVVFPDGREYRLPPGAIAIRGEGGNPLMAKKWDDKGPEIFSQDANAFLFGALSNVGRILNQPRSESYESNSGFGFGSSRSRINRGEPNVLGAVLEGGFSPVLASIVQRNTLAMQELRQRPNIWYVAAGKDVEVFVNQSLQF